MKVKNSIIYASVMSPNPQILPPLQKLLRKELPISVAFLLKKNLKSVEDTIKQIDESRQILIDKYAKRDQNGIFERPKNPDGTPMMDQVVIENSFMFQTEMAELMNTEVEIDITPIKLEKLDNVQLPPEDVFAISWMITE